MTFHAPYARLPGGLARDVAFVVEGGQFASITAGGSPDGATRLPGLVLPGFANAHSHAFHRALRGRTHDRGGTFWTWRERMYAVAARLDPDSYLALARATYAEMALAGVTSVGEFHYLHHAPGGGRTPIRTRWARRCGRRRRRRHPADPAGHVLPRRWAVRRRAPRAGRGAARFCDGRRRVGRAGRRACGRPRRARRRSDPFGSRGAACGPCPRSRRAAGDGRCTSTCPSSRPRTSSACARYGVHADRAAGRRGRARPATTAVHATHSATTTSTCSGPRTPRSASARPLNATWPTGSGRPGRCSTPASPLCPRQRPARRDRPVRRGARAGDGRAAGHAAPRAIQRRRAARRADRHHARWAGPTPGELEVGARADLGRGAPGHRPHGGRGSRNRRCSRRQPPTSTP